MLTVSGDRSPSKNTKGALVKGVKCSLGCAQPGPASVAVETITVTVPLLPPVRVSRALAAALPGNARNFDCQEGRKETQCCRTKAF